MDTLHRTAHERATMAMDRLARELGKRPSDEFYGDLVRAFKMAENVGEREGMAKGQALAKLTDADKKALGLI